MFSGGAGGGWSCHLVEEFLKGQKCWSRTFDLRRFSSSVVIIGPTISPATEWCGGWLEVH